MIPTEILKKVRRIEITTNRLVTDVFAGAYHSAFKGQGIEFDEVREYQIGDDIRSIDWNVTARTGKAHIKKFVEERELTIMLVVDVSPSCQFASIEQLKSKLAAELAAVLAFSAIRNNDKVGLLMFSEDVEQFIPARKGRLHVLRVIRELLSYQSTGKRTCIARAIDYLNNVTSRASIVFLISDFFDKQDEYKRALSVANRRHDFVGITLNDPREMELPACGLVELEDAETGHRRLIDSSDKRVRQEYHHQALKRLKNRERMFHSIGMDHVNISTGNPYVRDLTQFFAMRRRRML